MTRDAAVAALRREEQATATLRREADFTRRYDIGRVPAELRRATLAAVPETRPHREKVVNWMRYYADDVKHGKTPSGLYLYGPYGSGKSSLLAGILMWAIRNRVLGVWTSFTELYKARRDNPPFHEHSDNGLWDTLLSAQLVAVDDLFRHASERGKMDALAAEELLEARSARGLATVLSGNLDIETIAAGDFKRVASLLTGSCYDVAVTGTDYRSALKKKRRPL